MLYFALIDSELEYVSVAWNSVTVTIPINLSAYNENFQPFAIIEYFKMWNSTVIIYWKFCVGQLSASQEGLSSINSVSCGGDCVHLCVRTHISTREPLDGF
jgi:hypothetical protein